MRFERYTENAKRVVFYGRYEASQCGSPQIRTEHLLLGLFRGDRRLARKILGWGGIINRYRSSSAAMETMRRNVSVTGGKISTSVDIPLSSESKQVLNYAAEEAEQLSDRSIRSEHILLALLRNNGCLAAELLGKQGVTLESAREKLQTRAEA